MPCNDCEKAANMLQVVIDGEASKEDLTEFEMHLSKCSNCANAYETEKKLLQAIKNKISSKCCPQMLLNSVREKIQQLSKK